jgi:zinc transporter ZupT
MAIAALLTLLALIGVAVGILLGQSRLFSSYVAATGGGLLLGISLFWLMPEIASLSGWIAACGMTLAACLALSLADRIFIHAEHASNRIALGPILAATATHSFLDGWSVRALVTLRLAGIAAPIGLALHKVPEGVAIGWIARQGLRSPWKAAAASIAVELFTLLGAYVEAPASRSGFATFGSWWTSAILAVVSGSFLFLGAHAVAPNRRRLGVMLVFAGTLALVASIGLFRTGNI